jgi:hypothetical protein
MQTFLPYPDFAATAKALDWRRLGKQRVEARQIIEVLKGVTKGWVNHPAVKMWRGHEGALCLYLKAAIDEWVGRGYVNEKQLVSIEGDLATVTLSPSVFSPTWATFTFRGFELPPWLGNEAFHASHRSNLLRKAPDFYSKYGWPEPNDLPYVWPC